MVVLALRMSSIMVSSDTGVKLERELMGSWPVVTIQGGSVDEVHDEVNCRWMVLILVLKNCRKAVH